ncbi:efflux RND transporter periplasmic adaptor subunit [Pelomonas sp. KK5]|uniref:efflux RND transporter periplasmic adaptor subunit n=1 Tax=Pelomonas sp. KK5 TaxID=1855730 RepID=UPI00097C2263|nr:efflux RND transporter periplasmic adaptor subunit [Pelomonas sp. KK5]
MTSHAKFKPLLIAGAIVGAAALGYFAASRPAPASEARSAEPAPEAATDASRPKADAAELKIPAAYLTAAGIGVEAAGSSEVRSELLLPAVVAAAPGSEAAVVSRVSGTLVRVMHRLGDTVAAGEVLASIESLEAAGMASERRVAQAKVELARKTLAREKSLFDQGVTPRQALEAAQADLDVAEAEAQRAAAVAAAARVGSDGRTLTLVSPIAGRITASSALVGAHVAPDVELFRVAMPGAVQIEAPLTADDLRRVAVGDAATVLSRSGTPVPATVRGLTPGVNASTRAATVVLVPDDGPQAKALLAGEGVQVRLHARGDARQAGVAVPEEAVQNMDGRDAVFIRTPDGFRTQPVYVGVRSGGLAQVVSGLQAGQQVATRNAFLLKAEAKKNAGEEE